jgi:N-acetylmuramic acid 6-phosphate etherase
MIKLGKVYGNLMVDVKASNEKLIARAKRIVKLATDANDEVIDKILKETENNVKLAILLIETGLSLEEGRILLEENKGYIAKALETFKAGKKA